jgi:hypothetical protein
MKCAVPEVLEYREVATGSSRGSVIFVAMLLGPLGCQAGEGVPHPPAHDPPAKASAPLPSVVAKPAASPEAVPEQRTCTLIFCEDAVTLSFAPHLEAGRYVLVTADTKVRHCAIELTELG